MTIKQGRPAQEYFSPAKFKGRTRRQRAEMGAIALRRAKRQDINPKLAAAKRAPKLIEIAKLIQYFNDDWNEDRVYHCLEAIKIHSVLYVAIPPERRRRIANLAKTLCEELVGITVEKSFLKILEDLSACARPYKGWGGDHRSGEDTFEKAVLGMTVRLYIAACREPGFSVNGPLYKFVNSIGELLHCPPTKNDVVRASFRKQFRIHKIKRRSRGQTNS